MWTLPCMASFVILYSEWLSTKGLKFRRWGRRGAWYVLCSVSTSIMYCTFICAAEQRWWCSISVDRLVFYSWFVDWIECPVVLIVITNITDYSTVISQTSLKSCCSVWDKWGQNQRQSCSWYFTAAGLGVNSVRSKDQISAYWIKGCGIITSADGSQPNMCSVCESVGKIDKIQLTRLPLVTSLSLNAIPYASVMLANIYHDALR